MELTGKIVSVTCGPRGAGKTTFALRVKKEFPEILYLNQDKLFQEKFGTLLFYEQKHMHEAGLFIKQKITDLVLSASKDAKIILDINVENPKMRKALVQHLRSCGVSSVICWHFVTPFEQCLTWLKQKPKNEKLLDYPPFVLLEYKLYHDWATDINFPHHLYYQGKNIPGFDMIRRVDPLNSKFSFP